MALAKPRCITCLSETDLTSPGANIKVNVRDIRIAKNKKELLAEYEFDCASCGKRNYRSTDKEKVYALMHECGAEANLHPEDPPGGPPLTSDDLLDFHESIKDKTNISELFVLEKSTL